MSTSETIELQYQKWIRVVTLIHYAGKELCLDILHNKKGFPTDGHLLYITLTQYQSKIASKLRRGLCEDQYNLIFPSNGITNSNFFDITLFTFLFQEIFPNEYKVIRKTLRKLRNENFHLGEIYHTKSEFELKWGNVIAALQKCGYDVTKVADLKYSNLDCNSKYRNAHLETKFILLEKNNERRISELKREVSSNNVELNFKMMEIKKSLNSELQQIKEQMKDMDFTFSEKLKNLEAQSTEIDFDVVTSEVWNVIANNKTFSGECSLKD